MDKPIFCSAFRIARASLGLGVCLAVLTGCESPADIVHEASPTSSSTSTPTNNNAPTITAIGNVTTNQDQSFSVSFKIADADSSLSCQSSVYISAGDYNLLPPTQVTRSGTAPSCVYSFQPGSGYWGSTTVQLQVSDGKYSASTTFNVTVSQGITTPTVSAASANEGSTETFSVKLSHALSTSKSFTYATVDGTALAGTNYTSSSGTITFAAGETVKALSVPTIDDGAYTGNLAFGLVVNMDGVNTTATGTIVNIDGLPTASASAASAAEGSSLSFTVSLSRAATTTTTVTYATADGTAVAGTNYSAASGTLTFTAGQTSKTVTVSTLNDGVSTSNLTMSLSLTANGVTHVATGTIVDAQSPVTVSVGNVSVSEGSSAVFTVNLSNAATSALSVSYATANGTASAGTNYTSTSGTLTFSAGQTSATVTVPTLDDGVYTPNLTFTLSLSLAGVSTTATGTVQNTEVAPKATAAAATASEGANVSFTVTLDRASSTATAVTYSTTNGTALSGTNYTSSSGVLTIAAGQTSTTLTVPTIHDGVYTPSLTFTLSLTAGGTTNTAAGTVVDTDGAPTASVSSASAAEGSSLTFTVSLNHASSASTTVTYASADGTAAAGTNYTAVSGTLTFTAGQTSQTVAVSTTDDLIYTPSLTFTLSATANGVTNSGTGTVLNTETAPTVTAASVSASEGANLVFTVTLNHASSATTTVAYATSDSTAKAGVNYISASGMLTFTAGQISQTLTIPSVADSTYTANLTFTLSLTANAVTSTATGTVLNTDILPTVSVSEASSSITEGNSAVFTFTLNHASAYDVQATFTTTDLTALGGTDYGKASGTLTISAGTLSNSVTVLTYNDNVDKASKTFSMNLSAAVNASVGTSSVTETIQDTALWFDFTTGSMPSGLSFSRASQGTYYDNTGTLQTAASDAPRFEYDPANCPAGVCAAKGLLIEDSRSNLLLQSSTLNTTWVNTTCTLTAAAATSPTGASDAFSLAASAGSDINTAAVSQTVTLAASTTYTLSFFLKNSTSTKSIYELSAANSGTTGKSISVTWAGLVPSVSGGTVRALPNHWYRVSTTFTTNSSDAGDASVNFYPSTLLNAGVVYVWGGQLEQGPTPTSYLPTTTATATRAADSLSISNFSNWFNATTWTAMIYLKRPAYEGSASGALPTLFSACDITSGATCSANYFEAAYLPSDATFRGRSAVASAIVASSNYTSSGSLNDVEIETAVSQSSGGALQTVVNGSAATASANASIPTLNGFVLGGSGLPSAPTRQINGHLLKFTYRARALTTAQMQAMTTE